MELGVSHLKWVEFQYNFETNNANALESAHLYTFCLIRMPYLLECIYVSATCMYITGRAECCSGRIGPFKYRSSCFAVLLHVQEECGSYDWYPPRIVYPSRIFYLLNDLTITKHPSIPQRHRTCLRTLYLH